MSNHIKGMLAKHFGGVNVINQLSDEPPSKVIMVGMCNLSSFKLVFEIFRLQVITSLIRALGLGGHYVVMS